MNEVQRQCDASKNCDFAMPKVHEEAVEVFPNAEKNETNQLCTEPESATPRKTKRKSLSKSEGAETNHVDSGHLESCPNLDPLPRKDSNPVLLPEPEPVLERNETNQVCTEPESTTPRKTKRKKNRKSLSKSEGAETNHVHSGHLESCPNLDPLPRKDSNPVLLPEPEPVLERNETNQVCTEPESTTPRKTKRKRKRKKKSLSKSEGDGTNHVDESGPNLDALSSKDSEPVLLPEPELVAKMNKTNQLCSEPELATPRETKRKRKKKNLSKSEGVETNHLDESCPNLDALSSKDSEPLLLPEPEFVAKPNKTNTEPDLATPRKTKRKKKRKSLSKSEWAETNHVNSGHLELCSNLDPFTPKNSDSVLLLEPESFAEKNSTNQLCIEPDSTCSRKMKRKRKRKSLSKSEGAETNHVDSGHLESCPNLDPLTPKDSNPVLLPEPEPVSERNETNQLYTEPESTAPMKTKRKRKKKSLSKSEGDETNHVDESCPNLDALSSKDAEPVPLLEPELVAKTNKTNQLCTEPELATLRKTKRRRKKRKSLSKSEGAETNHIDSGHLELCSNFENFELCPKSDSLPPKDSDPLLLPQSETTPLKEVEQKKKRKKKKKKKNKCEVKGEGIKSDRPNDEHSQQSHKAKSTAPEEWNQRKRKRHVMNETHDSSTWSMVTPNYNFRPRIGASILNSEVVEPGPWVSKRPLNDYEQYERCLECRQICQGDQKCRGLIHPNMGQKFCFFCATVGHSLGKCPVSPGAKCAKGIIMLDDYVRKNCGEKSQTPHREVAPANVPTYAPIYTHFPPSNIQPYPAPLVRPMYAHFILSRN